MALFGRHCVLLSFQLSGHSGYHELGFLCSGCRDHNLPGQLDLCAENVRTSQSFDLWPYTSSWRKLMTFLPQYLSHVVWRDGQIMQLNRMRMERLSNSFLLRVESDLELCLVCSNVIWCRLWKNIYSCQFATKHDKYAANYWHDNCTVMESRELHAPKEACSDGRYRGLSLRSVMPRAMLGVIKLSSIESGQLSTPRAYDYLSYVPIREVYSRINSRMISKRRCIRTWFRWAEPWFYFLALLL